MAPLYFSSFPWSFFFSLMLPQIGYFSICFCSASKSCLTLCDPIDCSMPGFPVLHYLLEFAQTHVHWVSDAIQSSHPLSLPSPLALNLSSIKVFSDESALHIRWPSIGVSELTPVLAMNIQDWFLLGLNGLISLLSNGLSRVFFSTTVWKQQFFVIQPSVWSKSHIHTWLLEKP